MALNRVWIVLIIISLIAKQWRSIDGYNNLGHDDDERIALWELRRFFNDPYSILDWVENSNSDFCQWQGIECDNNNNSTTKTVKSLDLSFTIDDADFGRRWLLNATLFQPFKKLQSLSLEMNNIAGFVKDGGLEKLSNLEFLNLRYNHFDRSILQSLSSLRSLKTLILSDNEISGTVHLKGIERQLTLPNLEHLDLSFNIFDNDILTLLGGLTSLKYLNLGFNNLKGSLHIKDALLNLEELDISGNSITKIVPRRDGESLFKLKVLWLEAVDTNKTVPLQSLGSLPFLKRVHLGKNNFGEPMTSLELHNVTNVEELFMDGSDLHMNFLRRLDALSSLKVLCLNWSMLSEPLTVQDLPNFKKLEVLDMSNFALHNSFLQSVGKMNALKVLKLANCGLHGSVSAPQGLCRLSHVQVLDLGENDLVGKLPACMANLTSLQSLRLSGNQFTGNITESPIASLGSIQELDLSYNHFQIPISFGPFYNHSELKKFLGDSNEIYADVVPRSWVPKFQLDTLYLSCHGTVGEIPDFLYHQHDLQTVNISHIHFKGEFPNWLLDNNTGLIRLVLVNNSLSSPIHSPIHPLMKLVDLDISNNSLFGEIPANFGSCFPNLVSLNMSSNQFHGNIPSSFGDISSLHLLDLSNNQLLGTIPKQLGKGCKFLEELILSNNKLQGQIFPADFNLTSLWNLQLGGNHFTSLSDGLLSNSGLGILDISNNHLSEPIPKWMGQLSFLEEINMSNNSLEGSIPPEFCQLNNLQVLDLSRNNISGSIPSCLVDRINELRLSNNRLQGTLTDIFYNISYSVVILDLSHNHLTGSIPHSISRMTYLTFLFLNNNRLEGEVPTEMCKLDGLSLINLSHNNLSGTILSCLKLFPGYVNLGRGRSIDFTTKRITYSFHGRVLYYMSGIDLSCNRFVGEIPPEFGSLRSIRVLNLSHNCLTGRIPPTFANLTQVESLDLSDNFLMGEIPPQLVGMYSLSDFNVTNNNLSGDIPSTAQFTTFEESSYSGNPLLCGKPLPRSCGTRPMDSVNRGEDDDDDDGFMDMDSFIASLIGSYIVVILGFAVVLVINPYWRQWWFYHIEKWMNSCYYFVEDNLTC